MAKTIKELFYYGSAFTPIIENKGKGIKNYNFDFKQVNAKKLEDNKEKQYQILFAFLEKVQENIDEVVIKVDNEKNKIYDYYSHNLYFGGLIGVVSIKNFEINKNEKYDITLQLNSKLDNVDNEHHAEKPYFLMTLLFSNYRSISNSKISLDKERFSSILLLNLFFDYYKKAYMKGYFKTYHTFMKNDDRVKGNIDIARHIKLNSGLENGKIAYSFKTQSEFNYINHLIITSLELCKQKYYHETNSLLNENFDIKKSLDNLKVMINYPLYSNKIILSKTINCISHPYYNEYEILRKICIKLLKDEKYSIFGGNLKEKTNGVLVYLPDLWEKFLEKMVKGIRLESQKVIKVFGVNDSSKFFQTTRPDFVFLNENNIPFMILDAKIKPSWFKASNTGKLGDFGLLPDYDKCLRDMVSIKSHATGVIFPTTQNFEPHKTYYIYNGEKYNYHHKISEFNDIDKFYTFPIKVPTIQEGVNYITWKKEFMKNIKTHTEILSNIIFDEKITSKYK